MSASSPVVVPSASVTTEHNSLESCNPADCDGGTLASDLPQASSTLSASATDGSSDNGDDGFSDARQHDEDISEVSVGVSDGQVGDVGPDAGADVDDTLPVDVNGAAASRSGGRFSPSRGGRRRSLSSTASLEEVDATQLFAAHSKHIFILSSAGKPIFSRHGDEVALSGFIGTTQAVISFCADVGDTIKSIYAGDHDFVFLIRGPLYLLAVSRTGEPVEQLTRQLQYLYDQVLFILTGGIDKTFASNPSYDLRSLLGGTRNVMHGLIDMSCTGPCLMLEAVQCLRMTQVLCIFVVVVAAAAIALWLFLSVADGMPQAVRAETGRILSSAQVPGVLFAVLCAESASGPQVGLAVV